jgi:hypothetical protein
MMISLVLFGMLVMGPVFLYAELRSGMYITYGFNMSASDDSDVYDIVENVRTRTGQIQNETAAMTTGNIFTDFVNMLVGGARVLKTMWDLTGVFTNIINAFVSLLGFGGEGGWITTGIMTIILIIITFKILGVLLGKEI